MDANVEIEVHVDANGALSSIGREVRDGLSRRPKRLPSKYFYDERGSRLFERITELPEYYLTRAEQALLEREAGTIAGIARPEELVELGSGLATKTRLLLDACLAEGSLVRYVPVEVSREIAEQTALTLARSYPVLEIHALVGDFDDFGAHLGRAPGSGRRTIALLGSTLGNSPEPDAVRFLRKVGSLLAPRDTLLLGTDLVKDRRVLEAAYNDDRGITAEFNRNILNVINRHLAGDFDPGEFEHVARWNDREERIESFLRSRRQQTVRLAAIDFDVTFAEGELLWTEVSCKYTRESLERILAAAGLRLAHWLADEPLYALSLSRAAG
jgi:L-histidine N-alpha-methyltransferase